MTWVFGATVDGRVAAPDGTSRWISSRAARVDAHRLRAAHDAVLVGSGAARVDDPHLAVRHGVGGAAPLRVVVDAAASIVRPSSRVADHAAPTLVVIGLAAADPALPPHVGVARVPLDPEGHVVLPALLAELGRRGVRTVLLEGGPTIAAAFLRADLVDEIVAYVRAAVLGAGRSLLDLPDVTSIDQLRPLRLLDAQIVGDDVRIRMRVRPGGRRPAREAASSSSAAEATQQRPRP